MKLTKNTATVLILILLVAGIQTLRFFKFRADGADIPGEPGAIDNKARGNPQAAVRIVEYTDFQCPACARGAQTLKQYFESDPSRIYVQYRYFPLTSLHKKGAVIAVAAECAAQQGRFWPYHDILFERSLLLGRTLRTNGMLADIAKEIGLDRDRFQACLDDPATELSVWDEKKEGETRGVRATPTYFINGKMVVGAKSLQDNLKKHFGEK